MDIALNYFSDVANLPDTGPVEKNILVVEDDPFWQRVISRNIERTTQNCHIFVATSADEAIKMLGIDHRYSLIVADHYLEGDKTGYDLWWNCKIRGVNIPFLLTSGNVDFPDETFKHLPVKFISKPFVAAELRRTLAELLGQDVSANFFDKSPLANLSEPPLKFELTAMVVALALIVLAVFLSSRPPFSERIETGPARLFAPPPPIRIYAPPGRVAKAIKARQSRIAFRKEDILPLSKLIMEQSHLNLLEDPVFERSEGWKN